jgi:glycerophosphoryl diester phosphodiesterase
MARIEAVLLSPFHIYVSYFLLACTTGCFMAGGMGDSDSHERVPVERPIILARHGGGNQRPPDALPTFEWAWNQGLVPQADIRTTKDGALVASGESTPTAANGGQVTRFDDVLAAMAGIQGRLLYLDVKGVLLEGLANKVRERHLHQQVMLSSPDESTLRRWRELLPESKTLLYLSGNEGKLKNRLATLADSGFAGINQVQIRVESDLALDDPFTPSSDFLKSTADQLRKHGVLFQAYPAKSPRLAAYEKLLALGVESFAADEPTVALRALINHLHNK